MYIELHARSAFSFLEGSSLPEELVGVCQHYQMPAMALLDADGLYGSPRFHLAATKAKVKAHIGAEVSYDIADCRLQTGHSNRPRTKSLCNLKSEICNPRLALLVASRTGYQNLCRLITKMKLRAKKGEGAVTTRELEEHAEGLICLTGGDEGPLTAAIAQGGAEQACHELDRITGIFGTKNVYVDLQRHFHREEESRKRVT